MDRTSTTKGAHYHELVLSQDFPSCAFLSSIVEGLLLAAARLPPASDSPQKNNLNELN
jgi:hypothetical protein